MEKLKMFARRIESGVMVFNIFLVTTFLFQGLLFSSICSDKDTAIAIAADAICGAVALLITSGGLWERDVDESVHLFFSLALVTFCFIITDLLGWITLAIKVLDPVQYFADAAEVLIGYLMTLIFTRYVYELVGLQDRWLRVIYAVLKCLCVLFALGFLATLPMGLPFSIIDHGYVRGPLYVLFQSYPVIAIIIDLLFIMFSSRLAFFEKLSLSTYCLAPLAALPVQAFHYGVPATAVAVLISLVIVYNTIYKQHSRKLAKQGQELALSRINMMVSQIQPHFLYNALTSIANICEKNPRAARQAIVDFSDYLRVNLESLKCDHAVPFEKELLHCKTYLSFEKMRFEDDLNVEFDIRTSEFDLPVLSIQPLLENAVKHGICNKPCGGTVRLSTYRQDGRICVEISDDGVGFDPTNIPHNDSRQHIGLENVQYRIKQMCNGEMSVESAPGAGTKVIISLPEKDGNAA